MASHTIIITGINSDNSLVLSDNGLTTAAPGDTVTWVIGGSSGVACVTAITDNAGSTDVFSPDPTPLNSSSWVGTINPVAPTSQETEIYTINYLKIGNATIFSSDPEIQVNPR